MNNRLVVFSDGGARGNPGPGASSFIILLNGKELVKESKYLGKTTNNVAEYFAVLLAISWITKNVLPSEVDEIQFNLDSQLVVRQLMGVYKIKEAKLKAIAIKIKELEKGLEKKVTFIHIPREKNKAADKLVNEIIDENTTSFTSKNVF